MTTGAWAAAGSRRKARLGRRLRAGSSRGATIAELILWTVGAGLVVAFAVGGYNIVTSQLAQMDASRGLTTLRAKIESVFAGQANYTGLTVSMLNARGAIPDEWLEETTSAANKNCSGGTHSTGNLSCVSVKHPFDGEVTIVPDGGRFWIGFEKLDDENCSYMLDMYVGRTRARSGLAAAHVGSAAVSGGKPATPGINVPYQMSAVETNCDNGDDGNFVYFQFG